MSNTPELRISLSDANEKIENRIAKGKEIIANRPKDLEGLIASRSVYRNWSKYNETLLLKIFTDVSLKAEYSRHFLGGGGEGTSSRIRAFISDVSRAVRILESIIERLPLYVRENEDYTTFKKSDSDSREIFIAHGHDNELKQIVARFLEKLDLIPVILHEQASTGRTIIEKFETHANARFAVILLTADDKGCAASAESLSILSARARQNVIFEWGYFLAKLGRNNVCALSSPEVEKPSDMDGILCLLVDKGDAWKIELAKELKASGIEIDMNKAFC